jgi:hypothetical protein
LNDLDRIGACDLKGAIAGAAIGKNDAAAKWTHRLKGAFDRSGNMALFIESLATKTHVLNLLHRLVDGKTPAVPPIDAPQALVLAKEPRAVLKQAEDGVAIADVCRKAGNSDATFYN